MTEFAMAVLSNPAVYQLLSSLLLTGITGILAKVMKTNADAAVRSKAKDAVSAAVTDLYPIVRALKDANDGKLSMDQREAIRIRAFDRATEIGRTVGVDVMNVLGPALARHILEQTISSLKAGKGPFKLNPATAALLPDIPPEGFSPKAVELEQ